MECGVVRGFVITVLMFCLCQIASLVGGSPLGVAGRTSVASSGGWKSTNSFNLCLIIHLCHRRLAGMSLLCAHRFGRKTAVLLLLGSHSVKL